MPGWIKSDPPFKLRASASVIPSSRATVYKPSPAFTVYDLPVDVEDPVLVLVEVDALDEVVALPVVNTLPGWIKSDPPFKLRASASVIPSSRATVYKPSPAFTVYDLPVVEADEPVLVVSSATSSDADVAALNTWPGWIKSEPPFNERASDTEIPKAFATLYKPSPDLTVYDLPDVDAEDEPVLALELDEEDELDVEVVD